MSKHTILIPYTKYREQAKQLVARKLGDTSCIDVLEEWRKLKYRINDLKKDFSKNYPKSTVRQVKLEVKGTTDVTVEAKTSKNGDLLTRTTIHFTYFTKENGKKIEHSGTTFQTQLHEKVKEYYDLLAKRREIKENYTRINNLVLKASKKYWEYYRERDEKLIEKELVPEFWELARGLIRNTINTLYTVNSTLEYEDLEDAIIDRLYEGLMCFYDKNYKIDTFIYTISMSKISAFERNRNKWTDKPDLFHNVDEDERTYTKFDELWENNTPTVLFGGDEYFLDKLRSWNYCKQLIGEEDEN